MPPTAAPSSIRGPTAPRRERAAVLTPGSAPLSYVADARCAPGDVGGAY